jgi:hypothetical protein
VVKDRPAPTQPSGHERGPRARRTWLHPWTGVTILALDWLLFGSNLLSGLALTPVVIVVGAVTAFVSTCWIERQRAGRPLRHALGAALVAAVVVGAPLPLAGTLVGAWVIALSGLPRPGR